MHHEREGAAVSRLYIVYTSSRSSGRNQYTLQETHDRIRHVCVQELRELSSEPSWLEWGADGFMAQAESDDAYVEVAQINLATADDFARLYKDASPMIAEWKARTVEAKSRRAH